MMQCASCETKITDDAAKTGICPRCGLPLPVIGGTMRFSASLFSQLPFDDTAALAEGGEIPTANTETISGETDVAESFAAVSNTVGPESDIETATPEVVTSHFSEAPAPSDTLPVPEQSKTSSGSPGHQSEATVDNFATVIPISPVLPTSVGSAPAQANKLGDTILFGPQTRLVIQTRAIAAPETVALNSEPPIRPDYELVNVLGSGGMGVVYSARQTSVDREVAIKMIWPNQAKDEATRENFLSEAVITGELDHPNIVPIHDVGMNAANSLFYSMKRVTGTPWKSKLAELPQSENLRILMAVADAVAFAHSRGVVHRDLKPENVMLGDFGEVMVMDWGLAVVTSEFRKVGSVSRTVGPGCTPAYAAPELVTGPFSKIGPHSDVYLLGGILYEIVTGLLPHMAPTPEACCREAARNRIQPTTVEGELVEIALRAMATEPADRYASVQDFQNAIRAFQSHSESLVLSARAAEDLVQAGQTGDYQDFARAVFGYQQAHDLWAGNHAAETGLSAAQLAYAENALAKQDFDLGLTLLDPGDPAHAPVAVRLRAGQSERNNRRRRLNLMYRTAIGLIAVIFLGGSIGSYQIYLAKEKAGSEKEIADKKRIEAVRSREEANRSKEAAVAAQQEAEAQEKLAKQAKQRADGEKKRALDAEKQATEDRDKAETAQKEEARARKQAVIAQKEQEFEAYVAQIGLASEQINSNAFDSALAVLTSQKDSRHRGWEWYRLDYLARQGQSASARFQSEIEAVAVDAKGERFAAGLRDGRVLIGHIADLASPEVPAADKTLTIQHGAPVLAVAFSADDQYLVSAGESGTLAVWNTTDGTRLGPKFTGHDPTKSINRARLVEASGRRWLLTASADRTAGLWDLSKAPSEWSSAPVQLLKAHDLQVWDAAMSPDGRRIVTASEDGRAVVWSYSSPTGRFVPATTGSGLAETSGSRRPRVFTGHDGAIYAAAFSPDGLVATAGLDKRIFIWNPDHVVEEELKTRMAARADPLRIKRALSQAIVLEGHTEPIHALAFSPDGKYILSGSDDNTVRSWARTGDPQNVTVLRGHGGWVRSCVFSSQATETGDWNVISGSHDRQIKQWNVAAYAEVRALRVDRLTDHGDAVLAAAFNSRGDQIVTASRDHLARVWQLAPGKAVPVAVRGQPLQLTEGHDFSASVARYFEDGRRAVTSGIDGQVCLWDVETGAQLARLTGTGLAAAVAVSPNDVWILTGSSDQTVQLWKVDDVIADYAAGRESKPAHRFAGHDAQIRTLAISPDGSGSFYSGDQVGVGRLWNLNNWQDPPLVVTHHASRINSALFFPDGRQFATAADDGLVYICDAATGMVRQKLDHRVRSESVVAIGVTPDGRRVISVGEPGSENEPFVIFDWNADTGRLTRFTPLEVGVTVFGLALAPADQSPGALLAIGRRGDGGTELRGWNLATWREQPATDDRRVLDESVLSREHATVWSAAWSPDGGHVFTTGGYEAQVWSLNGRRLKMRLGPHRAVGTASFSHDSRFIATGSWDQSFKIWSIAEGRPRSLCRIPVSGGGAVNSVVFSPAAESTQILTAHDDGTARLWNWDPRTPEILPTKLHEFRHPKPVSAALFSPEGGRLLTVCTDGVGRIWDPAVDVKQPVFELAGQHTGAILCGAFSRDGRWIATGGQNKQIVLWNAHTGQPALEVPLQGHSADITAVALSETGDRLLTGSRDGTAKLWDLQSNHPDSSPLPNSGGDTAAADAQPAEKPQAEPDDSMPAKLRATELLTLRGHSNEISAVAFSPDGRFVLTAGLDSSAILWLTNKP
jgi:WD40 repeat protein